MRVAVVGATGLVGQAILQVLEAFGFPVSELIPVASEASEGRAVRFKGHDFQTTTLQKALERKPAVALFSAGGTVSKAWAPRFVSAGAWVIDNSSAWRMDPKVALVVPEVNIHELERLDANRLVANPNCTTIQLVVALKPLHDHYCLRRVVVSTYQAVTGTGKRAVDQLMAERAGKPLANSPYPHPIDLNVIPQCDVFEADGYTKEELKVVNESRKILGLPHLRITCTAARVPVTGGHSESVNVELGQAFAMAEVRQLMARASGIEWLDNPAESQYPTPIVAQGRNEVFVGRLRRDASQPNTLNFWVVADNLRKGAATNAVQIAVELWRRNLL